VSYLEGEVDEDSG